MDSDKGLWKAASVFAPDFPRQSSDARTIQARRGSQRDLCSALIEAGKNEMPGYYSVYSFPRGHSRDGNIPQVDCIFVDFDVPGENYDPNNGETDFGDWKRDMSDLLVRARMIAKAIIENDEQDHFRVALSGHKGLHLYLDFPTIAPTNGSFDQFKNGLAAYGEDVLKWLDQTAGGINIDPWVDVDASDLGRLARHPNTIHHGAKYDDKTRWCVPITVEELAELHVEDYLELTLGPRWSDEITRTPSSSAGDKVVQAIRGASGSSSSSRGDVATHDPKAIRQYEKEANQDIELDDVLFLTENKPCIKAFRERDDAYDHGNASHVMEISIIGRLVEMGTPRDVIHEFLSVIPGYKQSTTDDLIDTVVGRQYKEFNCNNIADRAPQFCLGERCSVYRRSDDIQK